MMESGSFSTFGGGAIKDTYVLYKHLKESSDYKIDVFADFSAYDKTAKVISESYIFKNDYDLVWLNSIRDVRIANRYMASHKHAKAIYVDRGDVITHYFESALRRGASLLVPIISDPTKFDSASTRAVKSVKSLKMKAIRDFGSKTYAIHLLKLMKKWLTCYVAQNAMQEVEAKRFFKGGVQIYYIPLPSHEQFIRTNKKRDHFAITVGRLEETQKKVSFMIEGIKKVVEKHKDLGNEELLLLCGSGPDEVQYKHLAEKLGVSRNIKFLGFVSEGALVDLYNRCAFIASSSKWETTGRSFIEGMACGAPVLLNDMNDAIMSYKPLRHLVTDQEQGLVYKFGDLDDFAEKFYKLYSDGKLRKTLGERAYEYANKNFETKQVLQRFDLILKKVMDA